MNCFVRKFISIITTTCFLVSFVAAPALQAAQASTPGEKDFKAALTELSLPGTVGRITGGKIFGGGPLVVNIQDLHCHAEVQKNISRILDMLDAQYGLKEVFVEGAAGNVDTSWLAAIQDDKLKKKLAEALVEEGRLTGTEYYSILNKKPLLLKGIEDKILHENSIVRLGKLIERRAFYEQKINELAKDLEFLKAKYLKASNRRFNKTVESYKAGKLTPQKYYSLLFKYAEKINGGPNALNPVFTITLKDYPNIEGYLSMSEAGERLRYKRIGYQLQGFVKKLKSELPFSEYNKLLEKTNNFAKLDQAYLYLSEIAAQRRLDLNKEFPDLSLFFNYLEQGRKVNPISLLNEEKHITEAIRLGLSRDAAELEVSFAADFFVCFKDYILNSLSSDDYEYFTLRFDKFKTIWSKYVYVNRLNDLADDFALLDEFYAANCKRNERFIKNIPELAHSIERTADRNVKIKAIDSIYTLYAKRYPLIVVVTGGFHTLGLQQILDERKISNITITPNVSSDAEAANAIYLELAKQQATSLKKPQLESRFSGTKMLNSSALQLAIESVQSGNAKLRIVANALLAQALKETDFITVENEIKEYLKANNIEGTVSSGKQSKTVVVTWKDAAGQEHSINIGKNAEFGKSTLLNRALNLINSILPRLLGVSKSAGRAVLDSFLLPAKSSVAMGSLIIETLASVELSLARGNLITGDGFVYAIARNEDLQELIMKHLNIDLQQTGQLPDWLQKILCARAQAKEGISAALSDKEQDMLMKSVLSIQPIHDLVVSLYAGRILQQSYKTAVDEFPLTLNKREFRRAHVTPLDTYFPELLNIRNEGLQSLSRINRNFPITRFIRNVSLHTYHTAKYWGTPAQLTLPQEPKTETLFDKVFERVTAKALFEHMPDNAKSAVILGNQKQEIYAVIKELLAESGLEQSLKELGIQRNIVVPVSGISYGRIAIKNHSDVDLFLGVSVKSRDQFEAVIKALKANPVLEYINTEHLLSPYSSVIRFKLDKRLESLGLKDTLDIFVGCVDPLKDDYNAKNDQLRLYYNLNLPIEFILRNDFEQENEKERIRAWLSSNGVTKENLISSMNNLRFEDTAIDLHHLEVAGTDLQKIQPGVRTDLQALGGELEKIVATEFAFDNRTLINDINKYASDFQGATMVREFNFQGPDFRDDIAGRLIGNWNIIAQKLKALRTDKSAENLKKAFDYYRELRDNYGSNVIGQLISKLGNNPHTNFKYLPGYPLSYIFTGDRTRIQNEFGIAKETVILGLLIDLATAPDRQTPSIDSETTQKILLKAFNPLNPDNPDNIKQLESLLDLISEKLNKPPEKSDEVFQKLLEIADTAKENGIRIRPNWLIRTAKDETDVNRALSSLAKRLKTETIYFRASTLLSEYLKDAPLNIRGELLPYEIEQISMDYADPNSFKSGVTYTTYVIKDHLSDLANMKKHILPVFKGNTPFNRNLAGAKILLLGPGRDAYEITQFIELFPDIAEINITAAHIDFLSDLIRELKALESRGYKIPKINIDIGNAMELRKELAGKMDLVYDSKVFVDYFDKPQLRQVASEISKALKPGGVNVNVNSWLNDEAFENEPSMIKVPVNAVFTNSKLFSVRIKETGENGPRDTNAAPFDPLSIVSPREAALRNALKADPNDNFSWNNLSDEFMKRSLPAAAEIAGKYAERAHAGARIEVTAALAEIDAAKQTKAGKNNQLGIGRQAVESALSEVTGMLGGQAGLQATAVELAESVLNEAARLTAETGLKEPKTYSPGDISPELARDVQYYNTFCPVGKTKLERITVIESNAGHIASKDGLGFASIGNLAFDKSTSNIQMADNKGNTQTLANRVRHELGENMARNVAGSIQYTALNHYLDKIRKARDGLSDGELTDYWHRCVTDIAKNPAGYMALAKTYHDQTAVVRLAAFAKEDSEQIKNAFKSIAEILAELIEVFLNNNQIELPAEISTEIAVRIKNLVEQPGQRLTTETQTSTGIPETDSVYGLHLVENGKDAPAQLVIDQGLPRKTQTAFPSTDTDSIQNTPAFELLKAFGLLNPGALPSVLTVEHDKPDVYFNVVRIDVSKESAKGIYNLKRSCNDPNLAFFDLVYNTKNEIIAIFPVGSKKPTERIRYVNLSGYYWEVPPVPENLTFLEKKSQEGDLFKFFNDYTDNLKIIEIYQRRYSSNDIADAVTGVPKPLEEQFSLPSPYAVMILPEDGGKWNSFMLRLSDIERIYKSKFKKAVIAPVFPTALHPVYPTDFDYYMAVSKAVETWRANNPQNELKKPRVLVVGCGSGSDRWIIEAANRGQLGRIDINDLHELPLLNTQLLIKQAGLTPGKTLEGSIFDLFDKGDLEKYDIVIWGMPAFSAGERVALHDWEGMSEEDLTKYFKLLSKTLNPGGIAVNWNMPMNSGAKLDKDPMLIHFAKAGVSGNLEMEKQKGWVYITRNTETRPGQPSKTAAFWLSGLDRLRQFISGMLHLNFNSSAAIPLGIFVTENVETLKNVQFKNEKYTPIIITQTAGNEKELEIAETKNLGITAGEGPVFFREENGTIYLYVDAAGANFALTASELTAALRGYGNLEANPRALKILGLGKTAAENAVVFDYTGGALNTTMLSDTPVVPGDNLNIGFGAILELDRAHKNARAPAEVAIERAWSDELLDRGKIESFNNSIVLRAEDIDKITKEKVRRLQDRGARLHAIYEGTDFAAARDLAAYVAAGLEMNGFFCPGLSTKEAEIIAEMAPIKARDFIVSAKFDSSSADRRSFHVLDLSGEDYAAKIADIQKTEFPVVKIRLGKLSHKDSAKRVEALKGLPASGIVIFIAEDVKENWFIRDITQINIFGVNLLKYLRLTPRTIAEKEAYQRRVAFELDLGAFESPKNIDAYVENIRSENFDLTAFPENTEILAAAKLHLSEETDAHLKEVFKAAFISRLKARVALAKNGKNQGLDDSRLEEYLAEALDISGGSIVNDNNFSGELLAVEVTEKLKIEVNSWNALPDRNDKTARAAEIAGLLILYGDERRKAFDRKRLQSTDFKSTKAILEAG